MNWRLKHGQTSLSPDERTTILETIRQDHLSRCEILAAVVMDDHVHTLVRLFSGVTSMQLAQAWKSISSHALCRSGARTAPLWQRGTYQRWIRHAGHLAICASYIRANPERKWPGIAPYPWVLP